MESTADQLKEELAKLRDMQEKWYDEARKDGRIPSLYTIARELGSSMSVNYGPKYEFTWGEFRLYCDDYGNYLTLHNAQQQICSTHPCDRLYIPFLCDPFVEHFAQMAREHKENREKEKAQQELDTLKYRLALS